MQITYTILIGVLVFMPYFDCAPHHTEGHTEGQSESEKVPLVPNKEPETGEKVEAQDGKFVSGSGNATFTVQPTGNLGAIPSSWVTVSKPDLNIIPTLLAIPSLLGPQITFEVDKPGNLNGNWGISGSASG